MSRNLNVVLTALVVLVCASFLLAPSSSPTGLFTAAPVVEEIVVDVSEPVDVPVGAVPVEDVPVDIPVEEPAREAPAEMTAEPLPRLGTTGFATEGFSIAAATQVSSAAFNHNNEHWTPDGSTFVYEMTDGTGFKQIYKMASSGGSETALTSDSFEHFNPVISPDGTTVAYLKTDSTGFDQVYKVSISGGAETNLTSSAANNAFVQWSPNGSRISFSRRDGSFYWQIWTVNPDGTSPVQVTPDGGTLHEYPTWSPDSSKFAYLDLNVTSFKWELGIVPSGGGEEIELTASAAADQISRAPLAWAPNSTTIYFLRYDTASYYHIHSITTAGTELTDLTPPATTSYADIALDRTNTTFAFTFQNENMSQNNIATMPLSTKVITNYSSAATYASAAPKQPQWKPDGTQLAWLQYDVGLANVHIFTDSFGATGPSCTTISTSGVYAFNVSVTTTLPSCINVSANDVTVDCQGHTITGNRGTDQHGINASSRNNVTIKNCFLTNLSDGIFFTRVKNSTIFNNTIINNSNDGIRMVNTNFTLISHNNLSNNANDNLEFSGLFLNITNNTVANARGGSTAHGVGVNRISSDVRFVNNTILRNQDKGLRIVETPNLVIMNNTFIANGDDSITIYNSTRVNITENVILLTAADGILLTNVNFSLILKNNISESGLIAISFINSSANNITNNTLALAHIELIRLGNNSQNNSFINNTIRTNATWVRAVDTLSTLNNNNFTNTVYENVNGSVRVTGSSYLNSTTLVNASNFWITPNKVVLNVSSNLSWLNTSAVITLRNISNTTPTAAVDYGDNGTFVSCPASLCTNVSYDGSTFVFNVSHWTSYRVQETAVDCASIGSSTTMTQSVSATGTCFTITANNVVLDCAGYTITYDSAGGGDDYGVLAVGWNNVTVRNCVIQDGTAGGANSVGVNITLTNNSRVTNTTVLMNGTTGVYGVIMRGAAENVTVFNNTFFGELGSSSTAIYLSTLVSRANVSFNVISLNNTVSPTGIKSDGTSENGTIQNNTILLYGMPSVGVSLSSSSRNVIAFNSVRADVVRKSGITSDIQYPAVTLSGDSFYNRINNNTLWANESSAYSYGVVIAGPAKYNNITNNFLDPINTGTGVYLYYTNNNTVNNNTINATNTGVSVYTNPFLVEGNVSGNIVDANSISSVTAIALSGAANTTVTNNRIVNSTTGISLATGSGQNYVMNNTIINVTAGIGITGVSSNNTFIANTIISAYYAVSVNDANNSNFTNTRVANATHWVTVGARSFTNFTNTTFMTNNGSVRFPNLIALNASNVSLANLNISLNKTFVNATNISAFNQSAVITLNNIVFVDPTPVVDFTDGGTYAACAADTCTEQSYASNVFVFNVSHWTSYVGSETPVIPPVNLTNVTLTKADLSDPVTAGNSLQYNITIDNIGTDTAYNVTLTETYSTNVTFSSASPTPIGPTNETFIIGNLTAGQVYVVNITVTVKETVFNGTRINNTVNISWVNTTGVLNSKNTTINTTVRGDLSVSSCGFANSSGTYRLSQSLQYTDANASCINMTGDNVVLDCNGFALTGNRTEGQQGINASGVANVTVKNCIISNFTDGIVFARVRNATIFNNTVLNNSDDGLDIRTTNFSSIGYNNATRNFDTNILISGSWFTNITNNSASNAGGDIFSNGIAVTVASNHLLLVNNTAINNQNNGILLAQSYNNTFISNTVYDNGDDGIRINLSLKTIVQSNLARNNSDDGISVEISNFTVIDLNNASSNFDNNIVITDGNFNNITNNTLFNARGDTFSNGITLSNNSNNNLIRNNTMVNNQDDGIQLFESNYTIVDNNVVDGNGDDGVDLSNSTGMNVTRNRISNNHFGIALTPGLGSTFTNNTIFNNTGDGIFAARHSRDNVIVANLIQDHTSALGNGINFYTNNSYQSNITIERNIIDRTGSHGIAVLNFSFNITIFNNTITNPGMNTSSGDGIYAREVKGLNITRNTVTGSNDTSISIDVSENITVAFNTLAQANQTFIQINLSNETLLFNNTISSSGVTDVKLLSSANVTLLDFLIGRFNITLSGITVRDSGEGEIAFNNRSFIASGTNFSGNVRVRPNNATVNLSAFNTSANLTLYGLTFTNAVVIVDGEDDGSYLNCSASKCTNLSYDGSTFRFNVSSWTTFSGEEAVVGGASTINASLASVQSLNFSALPDGNFNSSNIFTINYLLLNLSINASAGINDWYLNYTADGTSGCALGNVQNNICYHYDNASYQWIQFRNTTNTSTFDNRKLTDHDGIMAVGTGSANNLNLSLRFGAHYAPNVFKHYNASFNFSNFTWEDGTSQRIHQSNLIKIHLTEANIPIVMDADHYRFDITINVSSLTPQSPLAIFLCNSSYTSGDPHNAASCQLVGTRTAAEVRQNTHFREVFTSSLINRLGNLRYAVLHSNANNVARYYTMKAYKVLNPSHVTHWEYSTNMGTSWTNLGDGYETDAALQWFYDGLDPTTFKYALWVNDTAGVSTVFAGNVTWNITATQNWRPITYLEDPSEGATLSLPTRINFTLVDPNTDRLNGTITLWSGSSLVATLVSELNQSNSSTNWSGTPDGTYNLTLNACELGTTELYCMNETHEVTITTPDTSANSTCGVITQSTTLNASVNATGNCFSIIASNVTLNCNGHTIYWMGDGAAVNASHQTNVTVQNCFILDNSTLFGDGATTNTVGINFTNITIGLIRNNTILTNDTSNGMGIAITGVTNGAGGFIVITNNTINATGSSLSHYGIQFVGSMSNSNNVTQNVIRTGGTTSNIGVYMTAGPTNIGIYNNIIFVSGTSSVAGMNAVRSSNVKFNNITIAGTSNPAGIILNSGQGSNVSFNNITIIGTTSRFAGIAARGTTQNNLNISDNRIVVQTTSPSTSILEHAGIALEIFATNHSINNNNVTINNGYVFLVNDSVNFTATNNKVSAGSGVYVSNTEAMNATFVNLTIESSNGSINFPNSINITGAQNFSINSYNVSNNSIFLNSTNLSFFNVSANLVLNNLGFTNAVSIIDFTDTNTFTNCTASVCTNTSYAGGVFRFNVSHFTTFKAEEFVIQTPVYNFTNLSVVKSDVLDPVNVSGQLNYTILITVTNGTAYNITVNESFPSGVVFSTSSPAALADNRSFNIGNLTVGTVYRVNITVNVSNGFANNTLINNTANVTFQNETGGFVTYSANQSTTILVPPGEVNATNFTLTKTDAPDPVTVSTYLNYTINLTNTGNTTLTNVTLSENYSASVRFNHSAPSPVGGTNDTFLLNNLTPGQQYQVNITVLVLNLSNATQFNNTANVSFFNATGAFFTQNTTISTTAVNPLVYNTTNITVAKNDVSDPVNISALLNYTINITSTGTGMAYNVTLNETYPPEVIFITAVPTPTGAANDTFLIGNISAGAVYVVNVTVLTMNISNGTVINNTANVSFANETGFRLYYADTEQTTVENITIAEPTPEAESLGGGGGGGGTSVPVIIKRTTECTESWVCDDWSPCTDGLHERSCFDVTNCGTSVLKPETVEACAETRALIELPRIGVALKELFTSSDWFRPTFIVVLSAAGLSLLLALLVEHQLRKRFVHAHAAYALEAGVLFALGLYTFAQPGNVAQAVTFLLLAASVSFAALFFIEAIRHGRIAVQVRLMRTTLPLPPARPTITKQVTSLLQLRSKETHEQVDDARMHVQRINLELQEIKKQLKKK